MIIHNEVPTDKQKGTLIFLQKPMKRIVCNTDIPQIEFSENSFNKYENKYFISLPYVLFGINYVNELIPINLSIGFATTDKLEQIYIPTFYNIAFFNHSLDDLIGTKVCLKLGLNTIGENPEDLAKQVVDTFWKQRFNHECPSCMSRQFRENPYSPLNSLEKWETRTKQDPNWIPNEYDMTDMSSYQQFKDFFKKLNSKQAPYLDIWQRRE